MALTVGTDAYISEADAATYLSLYGADGDVVNESNIRQATLALDRLYGGRFAGYKTDDDQSLQFPRNGLTDIPAAVQQATVELALRIANDLDPYAQPESFVKKESTKIGPLEISEEYAVGNAVQSFYKVEVILGALLYSDVGGVFGSMDVVLG